MGTLVRADILNLTLAERIQLVEDIWDSIAECPEAVSLSDAQKAELDRRLVAYHQAPEAGSPWAIVRDRIRIAERQMNRDLVVLPEAEADLAAAYAWYENACRVSV